VKVDDNALSLKDSSKYTGLSIPSLRRLIDGGKIDQAYKVDTKSGKAWVIPVVELDRIKVTKNGGREAHEKVDQKRDGQHVIPLTYFEERRRDWESTRDRLINDTVNLRSGIEMYRYKFEELERQTRLLPAPLEIIPSKLDELEEKAAALALAENIIQQAQITQKRYEEDMEQLKIKLQEEEHAKTTLRHELEMERRPWWKKMMGMK